MPFRHPITIDRSNDRSTQGQAVQDRCSAYDGQGNRGVGSGRLGTEEGSIRVTRRDTETDRELTPTARKLLEVTEELCAQRGLESVSMRDIAKAAGISLSVIYHHFASKTELLKAAMQRRFGELYLVREPLFRELEAQPKPDIDKLLYAILAPIALLRSRGREGEVTGQFLARVFLSTLPEVKEAVDTGLGELRQLVDLAQRALPQLSREEICWRLHFTFGVEHMTHWDYARLQVMSEGLCNAREVEESIARAVAFAKAAFLAP